MRTFLGATGSASAERTQPISALVRPVATVGFSFALLALALVSSALADVRDVATNGRRFTRPVPKRTVTDESTAQATSDLAREIDRQLASAATPPAGDRAVRAPKSKLKWRPSRTARPAAEEAAPAEASEVQQAAFESPRQARGKASLGADPFRDSAVKQADFTEHEVGLTFQQPTDAENLPVDTEPLPLDNDAEPAIPDVDDVPLDTLPTEDTMRQPPAIERELADRRKIYDEPCPTPAELKRIGDITNNITPEAGEFPRECGLGDSIFEPRAWALTTYTWKASALCHKPLYFEEMALERYGHSTGPLTQPFVSGAHFFGTLPILPYLMGVEPPCECIYDLGYYRPGSCAPYMIYPIPLSLRGAVLEAGAWVGGVFLIP